LANEPHPVDVTHDLRGWFYRAIAPSASCAVLEVGDAHLGTWFTNVSHVDNLAQAQLDTADGRRFDVVVIHQSLGGCPSLLGTFESASRMLRQGGTLVLSGANRLRPAGSRVSRPADIPSATGWGYRTAATRAGFADVSLYVAHPPDVAPLYAIDSRSRSARAFFGTELAARKLPAWSPRKWVLAALIATNLMPYLQPGFIVVGRKC